MKLHLGVQDIPYNDGGETTGNVAQYLESEYSIMGHFAEMQQDQIAAWLAKDFSEFINRGFTGAVFNNTLNQIEDKFNSELDRDFLSGIVPGVTTKAAEMGVSHRFKDIYNKKGKRGSRPSFIDTGTYQKSFQTWIEE